MATNEQLEQLLSMMGNPEEEHPRAHNVVFGESGVGKTVEALALAQAITPEGQQIVYIDSANNWSSLNNHPSLKKRVRRASYLGLGQLDAMMDGKESGHEFFGTVGCWVVDELSSIAKLDLDGVLQRRAANDKSKDPDAPTQPDYYAATERLRRRVNRMVTLDSHTVFVCHMREDKDEKSRMTIRPDFMPAFGKKLRELCDNVAYMIAEEFTNENGAPEYRRFLQVHPTGRVVAKTRVGGLGVVVTPREFNLATLEWTQGRRQTNEDSDLIVRLPDNHMVESDEVAIEVE